MLESLLNHSKKGSNENDNLLNDLLNNLLSGQNAKVTIKIEAGKNKNKRDVNGDMVSQDLRESNSPTINSMMDELSSGLYGSDTEMGGLGSEQRLNRSPYSTDILQNLINQGRPEGQLPLELLLALASGMNPYAGSVSSPPAPSAGGGQMDLLSALLGGGAQGVGSMAAPPAGMPPFMEGMPTTGAPPAGAPSAPPSDQLVPSAPGGGAAPSDEELNALLKQLMGGATQ